MNLDAWGRDVTVAGPLAGGHRNPVYAVTVDGRPAVARRSGRPPASLDWELDLLDHLAGWGFTVPVTIPARDGRRQVDGWLVQHRLPGRHPATPADWARVAAELSRMHARTVGWPQRPGFATCRELLHRDRGGDVRLDLMPPAVAARCRAAWLPVADLPTSVVHGDPGGANVLLTDEAVGLLDWDESRVDVPVLDFGGLPPGTPLPAGALPVPRPVAVTAATGWEVATCWVVEPRYAGTRLRELTG